MHAAHGNEPLARVFIQWINTTTFEQLGPVARFSKVPKTLRARKVVPKTPTRSFYKAGLFICCKGEKS